MLIIRRSDSGRGNIWTWIFLAGLTLGAFGCQSDPDADIADISLELDFRRTDRLMWACAEALEAQPDLPLVEVYRRFIAPDRAFFRLLLEPPPTRDDRPDWQTLPSSVQDSLMALRLASLVSDSLVHSVLDTVQSAFPPDYPFEARLMPVLKRLKKHFPEVSMPAFRTHADGYPRVQANQTTQIIAYPGFISFGLHYFMGPDFPYYSADIYQYQRRRFDSAFLEVQLAKEIAAEFVAPVPATQSPTLLASMIRAGIKQYFVAQLLPHTPDSLRLSYTAEQMAWADYYEAKNYLWLIEDNQLFTFNYQLERDFLGDKPFTSQLSRESAPRIGEYLGWKIVSAYMKEHPQVSLSELCETQDYEAVFHAAGYRP